MSAVTFAVAQTFSDRLKISYENHVTLLLVVMEIPAIAVGVFPSRWGETETNAPIKGLVHEVLLNRSVFLLIVGVAIGAAAGTGGLEPLENFFLGGFKGALALFLLEMGVAAAQRMADLRKTGLFLLGFGVLFPLASAHWAPPSER